MSDPEKGRGESPRGTDAHEEERPAFKVVDRRRFAADGSERSDDADGEPAARSDRSEQPEARAQASAPPPPKDEPELAMPKGAPYDDSSSGIPEPSFGTLLISLSTQALMYLGEIPDLEGGEPRKDLAAARNIIDLIAVLERKTAGNLDPDEAALLERILYDLRMRFVAISRG